MKSLEFATYGQQCLQQSSHTILVSLLVPGRVRASVLRLLLLLVSALVEHLFEELELRRDREDEDQQGADQRLEQHCCVLLFSNVVVCTIASVIPNVVVGI